MSQNFITSIHIDRVRHLSNIDIPLMPNVRKNLIITGKNGSGKTSVLEALRLFNKYMIKDVKDRDKEILSLGDDPLKNQFSNKNDKIDVASDEDINNLFVDVVDKNIYDTSGISVLYSNIKEMREKYTKGDFILAYYSAERAFSVKNKKGTSKIELSDSYSIDDVPGKKFVEYIKSLIVQETMYRYKEKDETKADQISKRISIITSIVKKIYGNEEILLDYDIESTSCKIKEPGRSAYGFNELASGYAAILYIVLDIIMRMEKKVQDSYNLEGIVMIDEVDAHLHLSMQRHIMPILTDLFQNIQFIVTTHSPFVLNSISNAIIYDLDNNIRVYDEKGFSNLPYSGIVDGYFGVSELSNLLKDKFERYKKIAGKDKLSDNDYDELADLESYLDDIPDFLALDIKASYRQIRTELEQREEGKCQHG